ncbi:hypothetical protein LQ948_00675 [Jiella sp. MQZ9-1]|uniref:Uncharacterized protein n=1 Tax=Jiella flava TaxID=2816857 RepID=A0A939FSG5_9HYPH|nr:hypothetical protein [Jiella flava]MBO0661073.1 hypothetical protein [Jiella flava]MCD2469720.1 hypothetical protein [Jiella flava]
MVDQNFEAVLEGIAAKHEDKSWRSVLDRASSGMMSAIGMRRGPKIAESVARTAAAKAAYDEDRDDLDGVDQPEPPAAKAAEPQAAPAASEPPTKPPKAPERARPSIAEMAAAPRRRPVAAEAEEGPPSTNPLEIAAELKLIEATSIKDLLDIRRSFARINHPDRMPPAFAVQATIRMQIANRLIDDAIAKMSGQGARRQG